jgi:hypothetical protein
MAQAFSSSEFWIAIPVTQWPPRIRHVRSVRMRNLNLGRTILKLGEWGTPIFEDEISLFAYPAESILAEKLQTVVFRADKNSRMKDYYDIFSHQPERSLRGFAEAFVPESPCLPCGGSLLARSQESVPKRQYG